MTFIHFATIVLDENTDFDVKMFVTKHVCFFSKGFASPEGPGPGPASQEGPGPGPHWPLWAHIGPMWTYMGPGHARIRPATVLAHKVEGIT